jgi:hypothetical protein
MQYPEPSDIYFILCARKDLKKKQQFVDSSDCASRSVVEGEVASRWSVCVAECERSQTLTIAAASNPPTSREYVGELYTDGTMSVTHTRDRAACDVIRAFLIGSLRLALHMQTMTKIATLAHGPKTQRTEF